MSGIPLIQQNLVVSLTTCGVGVTYLYVSFLRQENHAGLETAVFDPLSLEVTQPQNRTGQNRPELCLGEVVLPQVPLVYLIVQSALRVLEQDVQLVKSRAILILLLL